MADFKETRYYQMGDVVDDGSSTGSAVAGAVAGAVASESKGYDELVIINTSTRVSDDDAATQAFINTGLYDYFNLAVFNEKTTGLTDITVSDTSTIESIVSELKTKNTTYSTWMTELDAISESNDYMIDAHIVQLASKVNDYFVISSALYSYIYKQNPGTVTGEPIQGPTWVFTETVGSDDLLSNLVTLYYESMENLKLSDGTYNTYITENARLNNTFNDQNGLLNSKQDSFDKKKAFVITMMAKSHKANKLYSTKQFWFMVQLILLFIYVFGIIGIIFASTSTYGVFNAFQSSMTGLVLVISNICILIVIFINELIKYFYR
jgi:hypothetical protein